MKNILPLFIIIAICQSCHTNSKDAKPKEKTTFADPYLKKIPDSLRYLVQILDSIYIADQQYRSLTDSKLYSTHIKEQSLIDSLNLKKVTSIIDRYGWMNPYDVGVIGAKAINLVMAHSDITTKRKYYPGMFKALVAGKISYESYALFEDKMNTQTGRLQYYGTQVQYYTNGKVFLLPVYEPDSLDARRKKMYLEPVAEYLKKNFHTEWSLEEYKKSLPAVLKSIRMSDSASFHIIDEKHELHN